MYKHIKTGYFYLCYPLICRVIEACPPHHPNFPIKINKGFVRILIFGILKYTQIQVHIVRTKYIPILIELLCNLKSVQINNENHDFFLL